MKKLLFIIACMCLQTNLYAQSLAEFQKDWAVVNYRLSGDEQIAGFEELDTAINSALEHSPNDAQLLVWQGIIKSTYAGKVGGLGALGYLKDARKSLEKAIEIDPMTLNGSAYTSLGALYYQVPGWPISFGSDKKARMNLEKALSINPDGIDSNYFYADFLYEQGDYAAAKVALEKAMAAAPRPGREVADQGRRDELRLLMGKIEER